LEGHAGASLKFKNRDPWWLFSPEANLNVQRIFGFGSRFAAVRQLQFCTVDWCPCFIAALLVNLLNISSKQIRYRA
jgi:hypothetical protein